MKEKNKLERLERFKNWFNGNVAFILILIIVIAITSGVSYILLRTLYNNFFIYPEKEYVQLEKEFYNIIGNNNEVDFQKLSDKSIKYEEVDSAANSYKKYKISLTKKLDELWGKEIRVSVEFSESIKKDEIHFNRDTSQTLSLLAFICICVTVSLLIFMGICIFVLRLILIPIEKGIDKKIVQYSKKTEPY